MVRSLPCSVVLAATLVVPACKSSDAPASDDAKPTEGHDDDGGSAPADMFGPLAKMLGEGLDKPGPYDEPRHSEGYAEGVDHWAVLELDETIGELETMSLFDPGTLVPLREVTEGLGKLAADEHVQGVVVRASGLGLDMATAEELRTKIQAVRAAGKKVACHTENVSNATYYVFTACETIGLAPLGDVAITGAAATPVHLKGLLDNLGVQADFLHVGDYKGAAEPLTRDAPSEQMIETLQAIVDENHATLAAGLVEGRGLTQADAEARIDQALFVDQAAVDAGLVDGIATWEAFLAETTAGGAWARVRGDEDDGPFAQMMKLQRFIGMLPPDRPTAPHVALVYAVGNVVDGKGGGTVGARERIASRTLSATLRAIGRDDAVRAVVLRVDSPGGSALASEQIHAAVAEVVAHKPVVVSMGPVAASGGYYISAGATKIFADRNTLTGSIGVVGGKIVIGDALERVGVKTYEVHRGARALVWSSMDPWTEAERGTIQAMMETTYDAFVGHVAEGRKLDRAKVQELAQGRVWTGAAAKANGLVDELGGLDAALAAAAELGEVEAGTALEVYPGAPTLRDLLGSFGEVQAPTGLRAAFALAQGASPLAVGRGSRLGSHPADPTASVGRIVTQMLGLLDDLRTSHIWAVSWVQPPR